MKSRGIDWLMYDASFALLDGKRMIGVYRPAEGRLANECNHRIDSLTLCLQTFNPGDDGTCESCGEKEKEHVGESKICPVRYIVPKRDDWLMHDVSCRV
eukprot:755439-Hanusia_phi.AAC.2